MSDHIPDAGKKVREDFEAWLTKRWSGDRDGLTQNADGKYMLGPVQLAWDAVNAATQHSASRIAELEDTLQFVERWANHHGAKPRTTPKEALSVIQHYPPVKAITRSYADGVVPDTFDPYARIAELEAEVQALREANDTFAMNAIAKDAP